MTAPCRWCGRDTTGMLGLCRGCKGRQLRALARVQRERLVVDEAGGAWWVWAPSGEVLAGGAASRAEAIRALASTEAA